MTQSGHNGIISSDQRRHVFTGPPPACCWPNVSISPFLAKIERLNTFRIIGALKQLWLSETAYSIIVTGPPVFFHGTTRKLVILRSSFVALGMINEMNNVVDLFVYFLREHLHFGRCSPVIRKIHKDLSNCSPHLLRILELVSRRAGPAGVLNFLLTNFRFLQVARQFTVRTPQIDLKGKRVLMRPVVQHPLQRGIGYKTTIPVVLALDLGRRKPRWQ